MRKLYVLIPLQQSEHDRHRIFSYSARSRKSCPSTLF